MVLKWGGICYPEKDRWADMKDNETVKILLADNHALFRDGLRHVLAGIDTEYQIIEATDYPGAIAMAHKEKGITLAFVGL